MTWKRKTGMGKTGQIPPSNAVNPLPPTTLLNTREMNSIGVVGSSIIEPTPQSRAPKRLPVKPEDCCIVDIYVDWLTCLQLEVPNDLASSLRSEDYHLPEQIWDKVNHCSCSEQAEVIYEMLKCLQKFRALSILSRGGSLNGREYLALPLVMAGEENFLQLFDKLKPALPRLGLDKGATRDSISDKNYPSVIKLFLNNRSQFFRVYGLNRYSAIFSFIKNISSKLPEWPIELASVFGDTEAVLTAADWVEDNYLCQTLHPHYFR